MPAPHADRRNSVMVGRGADFLAIRHKIPIAAVFLADGVNPGDAPTTWPLRRGATKAAKDRSERDEEERQSVHVWSALHSVSIVDGKCAEAEVCTRV